MQLALRVIDVSIGGVALFLPDDVPAIEPGVKIAQALIELDDDTRLPVGLLVHHVTLLHHESRGVRLGNFVDPKYTVGAAVLKKYLT